MCMYPNASYVPTGEVSLVITVCTLQVMDLQVKYHYRMYFVSYGPTGEVSLVYHTYVHCKLWIYR